MPVNSIALAQKLDALGALDRWPTAALERIGAALLAGDDWDRFRIDPLAFAARHGVDPQLTVEVFVHGVAIGLFELVWGCVCVFCGALEQTFDTIDRVPARGFHCTRCDADIDTWLDERVAVSFSLHPAVAVLAVDPFADLDSYLRYFTAPQVALTPGTAAYLDATRRGHMFLPAATTGHLDLAITAECPLRLISFDAHAQLAITVDAASTDSGGRAVEVELWPSGFVPRAVPVAQGAVRVAICNRSAAPVGVLALDGDVVGFQHQVETDRAPARRFFTGQHLLTTPVFQRLFRVQTLTDELALNVRHVALLFSDLVQSTELYDAVGDASAYGLVRAHFRMLHEAIDTHDGAILKTMGDAVMAGFSTPADAIRAGLAMLAQLEVLNREPRTTRALGLRVGIHAGPALVVHAGGKLDYFGQTVNIAARVQPLAPVGGICATAAAVDAPGVPAILAAAGCASERTRIAVRGVAEPITVCRITRPT